MGFSNILHRILGEDAQSKAPLLAKQLLGKKSRWPGKENIEKILEDPNEITKFIVSLSRFDPTGNQAKYLPYIVNQLAKNNIILPEDGPRVLKALQFFHDSHRTPQWEGERNIATYNWRTLEDLAEKAEGTEFKSKRAASSEYKKGSEKVFEVTVPFIEQKPHYIFYRVTEPEAAAALGMGTRWCTTTLEKNPDNKLFKYPDWHPKAGQERELTFMTLGSHKGYPSCAMGYLDSGPLHIVFRKLLNSDDQGKVGVGGQLAQFEYDGSQIKNLEDYELRQTSPALDWAVAQFAKQPDAPIEAIGIMRSRVPRKKRDYPNRPPLT